MRDADAGGRLRYLEESGCMFVVGIEIACTTAQSGADDTGKGSNETGRGRKGPDVKSRVKDIAGQCECERLRCGCEETSEGARLVSVFNELARRYLARRLDFHQTSCLPARAIQQKHFPLLIQNKFVAPQAVKKGFPQSQRSLMTSRLPTPSGWVAERA